MIPVYNAELDEVKWNWVSINFDINVENPADANDSVAPAKHINTKVLFFSRVFVAGHSDFTSWFNFLSDTTVSLSSFFFIWSVSVFENCLGNPSIGRAGRKSKRHPNKYPNHHAPTQLLSSGVSWESGGCN